LPKHQSSFCQAPVPFIIGVHSSAVDSIISELNSYTLVDIDKSEVTSRCKEHRPPKLPNKIRDELVTRIRKILLPQMFSSDLVTKIPPAKKDPSVVSYELRSVFLHCWKNLLMGYREYLLFFSNPNADDDNMNSIEKRAFKQDDPVFNSVEFVENADPEVQSFLRHFVTTQLWANFVEAHKGNPNLLSDLIYYSKDEQSLIESA
jgi:hypothetical protein